MGRSRNRDRPKPSADSQEREPDAPRRDDVERAIRAAVDRLKPKPGKRTPKRKS